MLLHPKFVHNAGHTAIVINGILSDWELAKYMAKDVIMYSLQPQRTVSILSCTQLEVDVESL